MGALAVNNGLCPPGHRAPVQLSVSALVRVAVDSFLTMPPMKISITLAALTAFLSLGACSDNSTSAHEGAAGAPAPVVNSGDGSAAPAAPAGAPAGLGGMFESAKQSVGDAAKSGSAAFQAEATNLMAKVRAQLEGIADLPSAQAARAKLEPVLEQLGALRSKFKGKLPGVETLQPVIDTLEAKFPVGTPVRDAVQPVLDRVATLLN